MHTRETNGFTIIELLIVVGLIGVIAAIAVPAFLRARMAGNESSAIASLRAINSAQQVFSSTCGQGFYAPSLPALGAPATVDGAGFISPDLAAGVIVSKSGFDLTMGGRRPEPPATEDSCSQPQGGPAANELVDGYYARANSHAEPVGSRFFFTNTSGTIYYKPYAAGPFADINVTGPPAAATPVQ